MGHLVTLIAGSNPCTVLVVVVGVLIRVCSDGVMLSWIEVHTFLLQTAVFFLSSVDFYVIVPSTCTAVVQLIAQGLL